MRTDRRAASQNVHSETTEPGGEALEAAVASSASLPPASPAVLTGRIVALADDGRILVDHPSNPTQEPIPARATVPVEARDVGLDAVLVFDGGSPTRPIVLGVLRGPAVSATSDGGDSVELERDGERLTVSAEQELVLRCGEASITLTREGKVLIRGAYVCTHASGVNRVRGGSVRIN